MIPAVLAVDGGNSKTDLALLDADGAVLATARGGTSSTHRLGLEGSVEVLVDLVGQARRAAGVSADAPVAQVAQVMLAGADLPAEEEAMRAELVARGWAERTVVANDTFAVLRAGSENAWGVAIVCGAGVNCVGVGPDGRVTGFPALGVLSGDWGGGVDVGMAAQFAAVRAEDGRGPATSLVTALPAAFGVESPSALAEALHLRHIAPERIADAAPVVLAEARRGDPEAQAIVERLIEEIVRFARVAIDRLDLLDRAVDVVLGGGLVREDGGQVTGPVIRALEFEAPHAVVKVTGSPPIVGAALLGLDAIGADDSARSRARAELHSFALTWRPGDEQFNGSPDDLARSADG